MRHFLAPAVAALIALCVCNAQADEVTLIAPGGIRAPIQKLIPDFERKAAPARWKYPPKAKSRWA